MSSVRIKLSNHEKTVLEDVFLYTFDSSFTLDEFVLSVADEVSSGCYPDSMKRTVHDRTHEFMQLVENFFNYHHQPDDYSSKIEDKSDDVGHIAVISRNNSTFRLGKMCIICDESFDISDPCDPRVICPRCKAKLKEIVGAN